jgi:hypothetical protein
MPFVITLAEIIEVMTLGGIFAGTITTWCCDHPGPGCVKKHHILNSFADVGPCGVPKYNFDICSNQLHDQDKNGIKVWTSVPSQGGKNTPLDWTAACRLVDQGNLLVARFDNVPPACMDLAGVLTGVCTGDGPRPTPCGSACMQYTGLSDDQLRQLSSYLQ